MKESKLVSLVYKFKNFLYKKIWLIYIYGAVWKVSKYGNFSGPYFPVFGLYSVNLRIQFEYKKIRTRKNSVFGHFSRSVVVND